MTEGQNWTIADTNSTYVRGDNCMYQLVSVPSDNHQINNYSNLQTLFANSEVILANSDSQLIDSNQLFDSKNVLQDCIIDDQIDNNQSNFNSTIISSNVRISIENESRSSLQEMTKHSTGLQGLMEADKSAQASTVIHMDDLKNELEASNTENIQEIQSTSQDFNINKQINIDKAVEVKNESTTQAVPSELDGEVSIELPKDPKELLDTLTPMLETNGGLRKNMQDSFLKIMKACDAMPLQCLLINIIRSSQHPVLKRLLLMGGFNELHAWLKEARSQINKPLMLELLQLFKLLPVTIKLLRTNSCAKDIKQLIKNNDERISRFARVIVDDWMKIVSGSSAKPKEKPKGVELKVDTKTAKPSHSTPPKTSKPDPKEKVEKSEIANNPPKNQDPASNNEEKVVKVERPRTVKRRQYTFRMTGLEEDATFKSTKKSTATTTATTTSTTTASALSGGPPSPKKNDGDSTKSNFFDALQFNSSFLQHRKRKSSVATATKTLTSTTSTTKATATTTTVVSTPSPVVSENDLSNVLPGFSYYKPLEDLEPSKAEMTKSTTNTTNTTTSTTTSTTTNTTNTTTTTTTKTTSLTTPRISPSHTIDNDAPVAKKAKSKKSVTWATENKLCDLRFFEVDPTERCNVNTSNYFQHDDNETFVDHRKQESEMERQLLQEWHKTKQPATCSQPTGSIEWRTPELIDFEAPNDVVPGSESAEKAIQLEREAAVLQFIYFDNATIPDFPGEPDSASETTPPEVTPCKVIPLLPEEETDDSMETDQPEVSTQTTNQSTDSSVAPFSHSNPPIMSQNAPFSVSSNVTDNVLNDAINTSTQMITNPSLNSINNVPADCTDHMLNANHSPFQNDHSFVNNNSDSIHNDAHFYMHNNNNNYNYDHKNNYNNDPNSYENTNYANNTNNPAYFPPYNNNNAPYGITNGADPSYGTNNNQYTNYNDQAINNPVFPKQPFPQSSSTPVYPIGFNQPTFDSSNQRPLFERGRGFENRGHHRDFHDKYRHNGNFPPKKNRNKVIDKNEVCRFFILGKCMFGTNCKKIHRPPK